MQNPLNETIFEEHFAEHLANSPLYNKRVSAQFDIDNLCDHDMLEQFLRQQPKVWGKLTSFFPGRETDVVIEEYNKHSIQTQLIG